MITITSFARVKKNSTSTTISGGGFANSPVDSVKTELDTHKIFGHDFNGTQDVFGDIDNVDNINMTGNVNGAVNVNSINVNATNVNATDATIDTVNATNIYSLTSDITQMVTDDLTATEATIDTLTVTKSAHFWELIIDKMKSSEGAFILSPANCIVEKIITQNGVTKYCWRTTDTEKNESISNNFAVGDQIICLSFNKAQSGVSHQVSNKYYWALVTSTGTLISYDDIRKEQEEWYYITLDSSDYDGTLNVEVGDNWAVLGNRNDTDRQNAIIMSSTASNFLDTSLSAPYIAQYKGINSYSLANKRLNTIAANGSVFVGDFKVVNGGSVDDVLDLINDSRSNTASIQTDNTVTLIMADQFGKIESIDAAVGLVKKIQVFLGNTAIPMSEVDSTSYIKWRGETYYIPDSGSHLSQYGIMIQSVSVSSRYDVTLAYAYNGSTVTVSDTELEIYIKFIHNNITYEKLIKIPAKVIKTEKGADAELDEMFINNLVATVTFEDKLAISGNVDVYHLSGATINKVNDLSSFVLTATSNVGDTFNFTANDGTFTYNNPNYVTNYSQQQNKQSSFRIELYKSGQLVDNQLLTVTFDSGSIFHVANDAITAAVGQSQTYTDGQLTTVNNRLTNVELTANGLSSRVTAIEGDYITSSELSQTADNIKLAVYDELNQSTGIDVANGAITLNANSTKIVGNLNITDTDNGLTVYDSDGIERINLQPKSIDDIATVADSDQCGNAIVGYNGTATSWNVTTDTYSIALEQYETLDIKRYHLILSAYTGAQGYRPTSSTTLLTINILTPSNTTLHYSSTLIKDESGYYVGNETIRHNATEQGTYQISATINNTSSYSYEGVHALLSIGIETSTLVQTYIGQDGLYSHQGSNRLIYANETELQLRHSFNGIRITNYVDEPLDYVGNRCIEAIGGVKGTTPNLMPIWLPWYNYTPIWSPSGYTQQTIINTGSTNKYAYAIDPIKDRGICNIQTPAVDGQGHSTQTWLLLPPLTFVDEEGDEVQLPVGYTVTIFNFMHTSNAQSINVSCNVEQQGDGLIIYDDATMAGSTIRSANSVDIGKSHATFIHLGLAKPNGTKQRWRMI